MTIDPEFFELMPTVVGWTPYTGEDQFGNNTYGANAPLRVRVEPITVTVNVATTRTGTAIAELGRTTRLISDLTTPKIKPLDRIDLEGVDMVVVNAAIQYDEHGPYYQEVDCKRSDEPEAA